MKKVLWVGGIVVVLVLVIIIFWPNGKAPVIKTHTVQKGSISQTVVATGEIVPVHAVQVKSQISGTVGNILIKEGDYVKKGTILATINPVITPSALAQAVSTLDQDKADYVEKHQALVRKQTLFKKHLIAQSDFDQAESDYRRSKAAYLLAKQNLQLLKKGKTSIEGEEIQSNVVSPIDGYVLSKNVDEGDSITPNTQYQPGTALFVMANMNDLVFKGEVSQIDIGKLKKGLPAELDVAALPDQTLHGEVTLIGLQSNDQSASQSAAQSQQLFATPSTIQNGFALQIKGFSVPKNIVLRAGYQATATILVKKLKDVLVLPQTALHFSKGKPYVLLPQEKEKPKKQFVKLGIADDQNVQVLSGLQQGQTVILNQS